MTCDANRLVHNKILGEMLDCYNETGEIKERFTPAKYKEEHPLLKKVDSLALANEQLCVERAVNSWLRGKSGKPKFVSKEKERKSYTTNMVNNNIRIEGKHLILPKMGKLKIVQHREIPEDYRIKSVTFKRNPSGTYYVSILCEYDEPVIVPKPIENVVGFDYSMPDLYVSSEGKIPDNPHYLRRSLDELARMQRALSRMVPGSKNYEKQAQKVAKLHEHIRRSRKDFLHKESRQVADTVDCAGAETLSMIGLSRSLHFGKSVADNGWRMFLDFLEYKLAEQGKLLVKVARRFPSSRICSMCGAIKHDLLLSDRVYDCDNCDNVMDRDLNAAINIKLEVIRMLGLSL